MISSLELARLAGVSQGTVDRALHGRPGVAEATRRRVLELAGRHGYRANPVAREMMGLSASPLVGSVQWGGLSQAVFFAVLLGAVSRRLRQDGLHLVMAFGDTADEQSEIAGHLLARRMRALLLVHADAAVRLPEPAGAPVAALVLPVPGAVALIPDEYATGRGAAEALLASGHRRLAVVPTSRHAVALRRRDGFVDACRAAGAQVEVLETVAQIPAAVRAGTGAVFCHNDPLALEALAVVRAAGLSCPGDVALAGVDGAMEERAIATMAYPFAAVAEAVAAVVAGRPAPPIPDCRWQDGASA